LLAILVTVLLIVLLPKKTTDPNPDGPVLVNGSDFPYNQNIVVKNTSTDTMYNTVSYTDTCGNMCSIGTLQANGFFVIENVSNTIMITDNSNNTLNVVFANLDHKVQLFSVTDNDDTLPPLLTFSITTRPPTSATKFPPYPSGSNTFLPESQKKLNDGDSVPPGTDMSGLTINLYKTTDTYIKCNGIYNTTTLFNFMTSPNITDITIGADCECNYYPNLLEIDLGVFSFLLLKGNSYNTNTSGQPSPYSNTGLIIYKQSGKIRLITIGQPLLYISTSI
jgi:hypothetical protein